MRMTRLLAVVASAATLLATAATATSAAPRFEHYVALGDSYTSGPFIPIQRTNPLGCGRSTANYPSVLAAALQVSEFTDVSCGAADTTNMTLPQPVPFNGTNPPQLDALRAGTDLVTIGIGGNDFSVFGTVISTCPDLRASDPTGNPCQRHVTADGVDTIAAAFEKTRPRVEAVLAAIHQRSPHARVLVVGYPRITPSSGTCPDILPFADGDYAWLQQVQQAMNRMLENAAGADGNATYVDTFGPSEGHDACASGGAAWINGRTGNFFVAAAYHPFKQGMAGVAAVVRRHLT
ncbi:SGNH/GDSL hydrolase family protein [Kibdelosporangium phytohabitans]|uniref:GDSL family lipase n=1 Tax=Kibdelosporangium phytohabitans TaxID=860235 RepID=A0A0N9HXJ0_9PSEU|nr:SGNH/GDSL hydrolase family protein [Kibdelosporangium phytohabitans]ALG10090.1 GDSL family lipase [Kibdelosporangium phytohabitans]MBE1461073.1 lysophospholipase L1-like esterase [Kibdelosporangium phytohabitans]